MRLTDAAGNTYMAHFRHTRDGDSPKIGRHDLWHRNKRERWWVITECTLHAGACDSDARPCGTTGAVTGIAKCSRSDMFDRHKGLKLAFKRAVEELVSGAYEMREIRGQLWASFWTRVKRPRNNRLN